eukprot:m.23361 g.23361  ORF g.23361 m.23361 type:complete len:419 (+) comp3890_c0_seq1:3-1259(+)
MEDSASRFLLLPDELQRLIINFLDIHARARLACTCRAMRELASLARVETNTEETEITDDALAALLAGHPVIFRAHGPLSDGAVHAILACPSVRVLALQNACVSEAAQLLVDHALRINRYETLCLGGASLTTGSMRSISESLIGCKSLIALDLNGNKLTNYGVTTLAWAVGQSRRLKALGLRHTGFDWDAAVRLSIDLAPCKKLRELDVSGNNLGLVGVRAFASMLARRSALQILNLSGTGITDDVARELADQVMQNARLSTLLLSHNQIGKDGADALAGCLSGNRTMRWLDLSFNPIGPAGAARIAESLRRNGGLQGLQLRGCSMADAGCASLAAAACTLTCRVETIDLAGNDAADATLAALLAAPPEVRPGRLHVIVDDVMQAAIGARNGARRPPPAPAPLVCLPLLSGPSIESRPS